MKYQYWLANLRDKGNGIGNAKIQHMYKEAGSAEAIFKMDESGYFKLGGITGREIAYIIDNKKYWELDKEWELFQERGIEFVTIESEKYPKKRGFWHNGGSLAPNL